LQITGFRSHRIMMAGRRANKLKQEENATSANDRRDVLDFLLNWQFFIEETPFFGLNRCIGTSTWTTGRTLIVIVIIIALILRFDH